VRIEVSSFVESDLDAIAGSIALDNPRRALNVIQQIRAQILDLGRSPLRFQLRTELDEEVRIAWVGRYGILFRIHEDAVRVERVIYGTHDLLALLPPDE
jgi:toxin ParE1/3/4